MKEITEIVAKYYGMFSGNMFLKSRKAEIVIPRQVTQHILRKHLKLNLEDIADYFDKNHATIIHSVKTVQNDISTNPKFRKDVESILAIIKYEHPDFFTKPETVKNIPKTICNPCKY